MGATVIITNVIKTKQVFLNYSGQLGGLTVKMMVSSARPPGFDTRDSCNLAQEP